MTTTTQKRVYKLVDSRSVVRDYNFRGTDAIIEDQDGVRYLLQDGYGGVSQMRGGAVRWEHGSLNKILASDTFDVLDAEHPDYEHTRVLSVMLFCNDDQRPLLLVEGWHIAQIAEQLGL